MVQPLKKRQADGSLYKRRPKVEKELEGLEKLTLLDIVALAKESGQGNQTTVSSEAIVYFLRREARRSNTGPGVDGLISVLINRSEAALKRHIIGAFDELQREEICRAVIDRMVDEIIDPSERADYAEVNFNDWLAHNRIDACRKQMPKAARMERLSDSIEDLVEDEMEIVLASEDSATPEPTPEIACALVESREKARLPQQIEASEFAPEDRYRIAAAVRGAKLAPNVLDAFLLHHYWSMPIDSKDPNKHTLVKHFGKSEKTIRNWLGCAEEAFVKLRGETNEGERDEAREPGLDTARLSD